MLLSVSLHKGGCRTRYVAKEDATGGSGRKDGGYGTEILQSKRAGGAFGNKQVHGIRIRVPKQDPGQAAGKAHTDSREVCSGVNAAGKIM